MKWLVRFLAWGTPLTWLATTFYPPYLRFLCGVAVAILARLGIRVELLAADVLAPIDLALFITLAMATSGVRWPSRLVKIGIGLLVLFAVEVAIVFAGIALFLIVGIPPESDAGVLFRNVVGLIGWAGAPVVWVILFQPQPLLEAMRGATRARGPARPAMGSSVEADTGGT